MKKPVLLSAIILVAALLVAGLFLYDRCDVCNRIYGPFVPHLYRHLPR